MTITEQNLKLLNLVLNNHDVTVTDLTYQLNLSSKKLKYEIEKLSEPFKIIDTDGVLSLSNEEVTRTTLSELRLKDFQFTEQERFTYLTLYLLLKQEYVSLDHLMLIVNVSRNTLLQDLKSIRSQIKLLNGKINYDRKNGYTLFMNSEDRDLLFINLIHRIAEKYSSGIFINSLIENIDNNLISERLEAFEKANDITFSDIQLKILRLALLFTENKLYISDNDQKLPPNQLSDQNLITLFLQSTIKSENNNIYSETYVKDLLMNFIQTFEIYSGNIIYDKASLITRLEKHFYPAVLRAEYGITSHASSINLISEEIKPLYEITKTAIKPMEEKLELTFDENEIALWTLYFAGVMRTQGNSLDRSLHAIVACPNGIAVSHALTQTLRQHFPSIKFLDPVSLSNVNKFFDHVDFIFSTHPIKSDKPIYIISQTLSKQELNHLYEKINTRFNIPFKPQYSLNDLLEVIKKNTIIKDESKLIKEIKALLKINHQFMEGYQPMLKELLTEQFIQIKIEPSDWKNAIEMGALPLLQHDIVTKEYIDAMINTVIELGPYIVIMPEIAIPHARPEDGAKEVGLAFANFKSPVIFPNDKPVKAMIVLSAKDQNAHLKALAEMTEILGNDEKVQILKDSTDKNEILSLINNLK